MAMKASPSEPAPSAHASSGEVEGPRFTAFSFTLKPTRAQERALWQHVGASRFAFNECRRLHLDALRVLRAFTLQLSEDERKALPKEGWPPVPWSGFDFIKAFTAWKNSPAAAGPEGGRALPWKDAVHQNVFEEACVDFGRAMEARSAWNRGRG